MVIKNKEYSILLIALVLVVLLSFFIKSYENFGLNDQINSGVRGIATFLFGILIAFSIDNRKTRLSDIRENLRRQDAILINIYILSTSFGKDIQDKIRKKFDDLLIKQIDYRLEDFYIEIPEQLKEIFIFFTKLKTKNKDQEEIKKKILDENSDLIKTHRVIMYQVSNKMMFLEWITLALLSLIILFSISYMGNQSLLSIVLIALVGICLFIPLLILRQIDTLKWQEKNWIWRPLSDLFLELDLLPYVPTYLRNRINIKDLKGEKIRLVSYSYQYPDFRNKKTKIIDIKDL
jgi:hypothetical protein